MAFADGLLQICYRGKSVFSSSVMYPTGWGGGGGGGGGGALKFLEQKKGGYENCLNISWGDAYFFVRFCLVFVEMISKDCKQQGYFYLIF